VVIITANDLTQATVATAQAFTVVAIAKNDVILRAFGNPVVPFQNTLDPAFNSDTVSVGDTGSATRFTTATEANANGAFAPVLGNTPFLYAANDSLVITVNSMAAKALASINRGEYHVFLSWFRSSYVSNAIARTAPSKP
jgi:hypothetical protein